MMKYFLRSTAALGLLATLPAGAQQGALWSKGDFSLQLKDREAIVLYRSKPLVRINSLQFNFEEPQSVSILSHSADTLTLQLAYPAYAHYGNETGPLTAEVKVSVKDNALHFTSQPQWAYNTSIRLKDAEEHFFGIVEELYPNNRKSPDLRGEVVDVDPIGEGNHYHENYSSVWSAFYMTNKGYASFFDTWARGRYKLGVNGVTELYHQTGNLDWYVIAGNNGDSILKGYYGIIGKPKFVPLWACGPVGWRDENKGGKDEILSDVQKMTALKAPFTAWLVDRPYSDGANEWSKMNFNARFADPKSWIGELNKKYGLQFMTWIGPMTFTDTAFPALLPNFKGYIDLTNPAGVQEFKRRLAAGQYSANVRGHKMDRAEEDFPQTSAWFDKTPEPERRAKYLYLYSKVTDESLREAYADDQFNFARGAYHRCQPYLSGIWGGDSRSSWDGMASNLANGIRASFMGFPVWGSDVGGYLGGRISEQLYARWLELGAWSGLYEIKLDDAGGRGADRTPWSYSSNLQNIFKKYCEQRMRLQPLVYSVANTSYKNGVAMKPLAYVWPEDSHTYGIWDEYLFAGNFLVAPMTDSTDRRQVYLPAGVWYDYYHPAQTYEGGKSMAVQKPLDEIPVFVRAGALWIEGVLNKGNSALWENGRSGDLQVYYFPGAGGEASFDYVDVQEGNAEKTLRAKAGSGQVQVSVPALGGNAFLNVRLDAKPKAVTVNNKKAVSTWDPIKGMLVLPLKDRIVHDISIQR